MDSPANGTDTRRATELVDAVARALESYSGEHGPRLSADWIRHELCKNRNSELEHAITRIADEVIEAARPSTSKPLDDGGKEKIKATIREGVYERLSRIVEILRGADPQRRDGNDEEGKEQDQSVSNYTQRIKEVMRHEQCSSDQLVETILFLLRFYGKEMRPLASLISKIGRIDPALAECQISFNQTTRLRQAFWEQRELVALGPSVQTDCRASFLRTIRINDLPFAETVFVQLMREAARTNGINLVIESAPWSATGQALLNNSIDIAFHNDSLANQFFSGLSLRRAVVPDRDVRLFRSKEIYSYDGYYIVAKHEFTENDWRENAEQTAVVKTSDFSRIYRCLTTSDPKHYVRHIDEGIQDLLGREQLARYCIVGAIHAWYLKNAFGSTNARVSSTARGLDPSGDIADFEFRPCSGIGPTKVHLWTCHTNQSQADSLMEVISGLWRCAVEQWTTELCSTSKKNIDQKRDLVVLVNRKPHSAFVDKFETLRNLVSTHDKLCDEVTTKAEMIDPTKFRQAI